MFGYSPNLPPGTKKYSSSSIRNERSSTSTSTREKIPVGEMQFLIFRHLQFAGNWQHNQQALFGIFALHATRDLYASMIPPYHQISSQEGKTCRRQVATTPGHGRHLSKSGDTQPTIDSHGMSARKQPRSMEHETRANEASYQAAYTGCATCCPSRNSRILFAYLRSLSLCISPRRPRRRRGHSHALSPVQFGQARSQARRGRPPSKF